MTATPDLGATPAVRAVGLTKRFGDFTAVNDVSITIGRGEIFGFLGPNGSGKSTTIRMLAGLLRPSAGEIEVLGVDVAAQPDAVKARTGYTSQRFSLYDDLTVFENLAFYGSVYGFAGNRLRSRIAELLDLADLAGAERRRPRELSAGHRQRLALAAAMIHHPEILFLDEPTSGVDPAGRRRFWELIYDTAEARGTTVMVTTHFMDEAEYCGRIAFIHGGEVIAQGSPTELKGRFAPAFAGATRPVTLNDVFIHLARGHRPAGSEAV